MDLIFLQNSATQPRCHKRYRAFANAGVKGLVYSFHRNWYNVNLPDDIEINNLGEITPGHHFSRLLYYIKQIKPVFKKYPKACYYCYGMDMAFVALLFNKKYVYEESDLEYLPFGRLKGALMKKLDMFIQKRSVATVLTSQGFVDYLYKEKPSNVFVLPNKLPASYENMDRPKVLSSINMDKLRFAFAGLLRYKTTITPFVEEMTKFNPNFEFHFWGDGGAAEKEFVKELCEKYEKVYYHGPFKNPDDLPSIYSSFDINFACYEFYSGNERIAEPNKLYESMFFLKPIMVSPGTYVSRVVEKNGNGYVVDCYDRDSIRSFLSSLNERMLIEKVRSISEISLERIIDSKEDVMSLINHIKKNIKI